METLNYRLDQFEGPLDLLLSLIVKNRINVDDVPIVLLCDQYMEYINRSIENRIEPATEFLLMASELMLIKSRMLLPRSDDAREEDPRRELVNAVLEYQKAKLGAKELQIMFSEYGDRMIKEEDDVSLDKTYVAPHSVEALTRALTKALAETRATSETVKNSFETIVRAPRVSLKTVVGGLIRTLRERSLLYLDEYFLESCDYSEMIARFLGILELLKSHVVEITDAASENGVTNLSAHIPLTLNARAEESRLRELDELDFEEDSERAAEFDVYE